MSEPAFMKRALDVARTHLGLTAPNPCVGCVIVKNGEVIAEGATGVGGRPHAEEVALAAAGEAARGAIVYVTLEPCGQRSAQGPSCAERLIAAGVMKMISACGDASPYASGKGLAALRAAGVAVETGMMQFQVRAALGYK